MLDQQAPPESDEEGTPPSRWSRIRRRLTTREALITAALVVPLLVWAYRVVGFGNRFQYWSDNANNELITLDVGSEFVAIGSYSRMVWSHPGPMAYYLLALPAHLTRQNSVGAAMGVLLINTAAILGMLFIARRRGGTLLMGITAAMVLVYLHGLTPAFLVDIWHPSLPILPYGLLLFLCWEIALGERWSLPWGVAVATFCIHEHVGYVVVATAPLLFACIVGYVTTRAGPADGRKERMRTLRRPVVVALAVGLVLWTPPIIDEIAGNPGNLILLGAYFNDADGEEPAGLGFGWERQQHALSIRPTWATGEPPVFLLFREGWQPSPAVPVTLIVLAVGLALAIRRRDRAVIVGGSVAAFAVLVGVVAGSRITGFQYFYLTRWTMTVGWFASLMAVWALVSALLAWRPSTERLVLRAALAVTAVMALLFTSNVVHQGNPQDPWGPVAHEIATEVRDYLPPGKGNVQLMMNTDFQSMGHRSALVTALERVGVSTTVDSTNPITHGRWRTGIEENPRVRLVVVSDRQIEDYEDRSRFRLVALARPDTEEERRETERYLDELEERLDDGEIPSFKELRRAIILAEKHTIAVFEILPED